MMKAGALMKAVTLPRPLVSASWLKSHLASVRVIDASWYLPKMERNAEAEFDERCIPGARFWPLDEFSSPHDELPHMFPSLEQFRRFSSEMGVKDSREPVVIYDGHGMFSAPRVWYTFRLFGHHNVSVLNGGMPAWLEADGGVSESNDHTQRDTGVADLNLVFDEKMVASMDQVIASQGKIQILDGRPGPRFEGLEEEPRPGLHKGHMPESTSVPFMSLFDPIASYPCLLQGPELAQHLARVGVSISKPTITSCGSGVSAAVVALAIKAAGGSNFALYDGSWAEYGNPKYGNKVLP
eukprot:TRINITY_DN1926_c0_g1_i1.p1 TRINITY_DN1926_c0_g1~~TRINITY_DN1926_c0_g1_i1.p1  ORF type:complete len:296 (-),score=61.31 TRINITY_DN1926_c0_g1_i1:26-913(-)